MSDGSSNTAVFSEIRKYNSSNDMRGWWAGIQGCEYVHTFTPNTSAPDLIRGGGPGGAWCVNDPDVRMPCAPAVFNFIPAG